MFRETNIRKLAMLFLRRYWSITRSGVLSVAYKLLYCCLAPFRGTLDEFSVVRDKEKLLAMIPWTYGSALKYLRDTYGSGINIEYIGTSDTVWIAPNVEDDEMWIDEDGAVYITPTEEGASGINVLVITVPRALADDAELYAEFIADVNTLILEGITYKIEIV